MSKKMWNKIFKSKSQKPQALAKINKRHSRGIYEEYQQLNDLLAGEKPQLSFNDQGQNEKENEHGNGNGNGCGNGNGSINVFEQQPRQSSFNSLEFSEAHQQQQRQQQYQQSPQQQQQHQQQLSTFSRVRNTFSLKRGNNNKKQLLNAKSTTTTATTDSAVEDSMQGADEDPLPSPPPPLTTGSPLPEHAPPQSSGDLTPCPCCSRTFNLDALRKHIVICEKTSKKRKVFDSSRQRRDGTALSTYVLPKNFGLPNAERTVGVPVSPAAVTTPVVATPAEAQSFPRTTARASLRKAASTVSNSSSTETPPAAPVAPPPTSVRERSQAKRIKAPACDRCPHCERTFNPKAFDRHVEWCKEKAIQANMKSSNSQETSKAKERLEARKQYKPPNLKTKRSVARDKYSGNHEELLEAGDMSAPKPNMMSLSMTSSVHSDNVKVIKARTSLAPTKETRGRAGTKVTQNQVTLDMSNDEDVASSPASSVRTSTSSRRLSKRKQLVDTCSEIDDTMDRIKRNSLKLATLDCNDAPMLQPKSKTRRAVIKRGEVDGIDKELNLSSLPQVTMTFDELNGLIKRKGGTPICNLELDEQEITTKERSTTSASMVRQARRRISTRESPNLGLQSLDSSLMPLQRSSNYSGSDDDDVDSPRAEIQIKLEATTMRTVCRPQKRSGHGVRMINHSEPKRALALPGLKQSLDAINKSMEHTVLPSLKMGNDRSEYAQEAEDVDNYNSDLDYEEEGPASSLSRSRDQEDNQSDEHEEYVEEEQVLRLPPLVKQNSNISRRLIVEQDENGTVYIKSSPKAKRSFILFIAIFFLNSGLGDKYDPFLSAKRQLEELCSPSTPPPEEEVTTIKSILTPTATATPSIAMSTSLTSTGSSKPVQIASKTSTSTSNFRRTSSLRGPRRNVPLLNSRPLFATNYRPTIQRGLSDEGPISTNFLKPEEYDEMPVRAACGNDFHSPRVVRRDTSASNRKQPLKLPVTGTNEGSSAASSVQPTRTVAKTDSLAVFLKYEHELEQLNAKAAELATASQLTSKELKDKSNTLSKQNSAKSLGQSTPTQLPPLTPTGAVPPSPTLAKENHYPPVATPLRLEPICNKPSMMVSQQPSPLTPIKLESIFGTRRELGSGMGSVSGAGSVAGDYIDPKLINACDNLHVNSGISSDASSTPQQLSQSRSRSSSQSTITHERRQSGEARNLLKRKMRLGRNQFLYDASPEDADASSGCSADDEANRSSMEYDEQCWQQQQKQLLANPLPLVMPMVHSAMPTFDDFDFEEFLSSFENENDDEQFPLFKDCREFLLNRSTSRHRSFQKAATSTPQTATQQTNPQPHSQQSKSKDNYAHATHRSDVNMTSQSQPEERLQRQQSNASRTSSSHEEKQSRFQEIERRADAEDQQKREIFISIETEANAQGRSPISPESLRHMVGNPQTPIDVLHIENGNEPEHARFSKISDTEDAGHESGDRASQLGSNANTNRLAQSLNASTLAPNVQLNNAKNLMQQMQSDFRQLGEEASASVRRQLMLNSGRSEEHQQQQFRDQEAGQHQQQQQHVKANSPLTPSPSADSDELSSLDGYPMSSSQSSRRGASSKLSSDSAYGSSNSPYSLSRQRSSELQPIGGPLHRSQGLLRPHTASAKLPSTTSDASTQAQTQYGTLKARQRLFGNGGSAGGGSNGNGEGAESYSSGSEENSQQPIQQQQQQQQQASNYNYQQQQYQPSQPTYTVNNNIPMTPTISQHSLLSNTSNNSMSSSMKMSKFCHECGAKFIIEHAKFCMDCGVRRMVL
ncbi:LOW QUALITY PROTEIN: uncharacterized protein LOC110182198 [Drosophila serrata]|uniref:LOW QUALITY PROTEIN: uncharacterized protein LOC110182198 n=1 Tax=Drosophila serrata TaxID=7274 RepID=UPI000A1D2BC1|nr:LOW QUALITY PROTEIN: uncharacterized protein LOC110182198 [Drosophila serrata]